MIPGVADLARAIIDQRRALRRGQPVLVAISGIDASGKGTLARDLTTVLGERGLHVEPVGADAWLNPLARLNLETDPAAEFYGHAIRFDEMFGWIDNLRETERSCDVVLVEGIFLFKRELRPRYDLSIWLDCRFETALERALVRNQEGLPRPRLLEDYQRIYFPAQEFHLRCDSPIDFADIVHPNDAVAAAAESI